MKTKVLTFFLLAGVLAVCLPVSSHHGNAAYDESKDVVLKDATVTKFAWANPHCLVSFDVKDDKGNVAHWVGELGSPSALTLVGFTKASVQPGDVITIHIHQSKVNNVVGRISRIVFSDGTSLPKVNEGNSPYRNGETSSY
jgi:hypothetical protein